MGRDTRQRLWGRRVNRYTTDGVALVAASVLAGWSATEAIIFAAVGAAVLFDVGRGGPFSRRVWTGFAQGASRLAILTVVAVGLFDEVGVLALWAWSVLAVVAGRALSALARRLFSPGEARPIAIVGAGKTAAEVAKALSRRTGHGFEPIGFIDAVEDEDLPLPVLGHPRELDNIVEKYHLEHLIIAFGTLRESELVEIVRLAGERGMSVFVLPRFFELASTNRMSGELWGWPIQRIDPPAPARASWRAKRIFDVVVASTMLVLTLPLSAVVATLVKLSSPGPVIFRQERVGRSGEIFELLKFRTMTVNGDSDVTWSVSDDQRVTSVGHFLRESHLDELPQLINVIGGKMSLVGPRPERPFFVDQFQREISSYSHRHLVPGGVTGLAQVNGLTGDTSISDRARFDNLYIQNWSLASDFAILLRTFKTIFPIKDEAQDGLLDTQTPSSVLIRS